MCRFTCAAVLMVDTLYGTNESKKRFRFCGEFELQKNQNNRLSVYEVETKSNDSSILVQKCDQSVFFAGHLFIIGKVRKPLGKMRIFAQPFRFQM